MLGSLSGGLATMCPAVPYAIAAKFVHPDRPVIACIGDGAMQMLGMNALITAARHAEEWSNRQLIVLVLNNGDLNHVTWEQRALQGDRRFAEAQDVPQVSWAGYAKLLGLRSVVMKQPADVVPGWKEALSFEEPCIVEAYTDPDVPFLPPHIDLEQALAFWKAMLTGERNVGHIVRQSVKDLLA
jgi:pyruvate dehydrogenase (quinone)